MGARATRSTHPQSLEGFSRLFSRVFQERMRVDNPSFWRTKKEVVEQIARLGFAELIRHTRSCADVHNLTRMHPHCGRCSQCIDRYVALRAAGLEAFDPLSPPAAEPEGALLELEQIEASGGCQPHEGSHSRRTDSGG